MEYNIDDSYEIYDNYGTPNSFLLKEVIEAGFKPIGITVLMCEETFIFRSKKESEEAGAMFLPEGWWYDFGSWEATRENYVKEFYGGDKDIAPTIYWLDINFKEKI
jgi:hypothetical protein